MRKLIIAGNWKMNNGPSATRSLLAQMKEKITDVKENVRVLVCPPSVSLPAAAEALNDLPSVDLGAQNVHFEESGAYTGEISTEMLSELGVNYVIVGHSERREYFGETDEIINKKVLRLVENGFIAIICVGERLEERKDGSYFDVVKTQLKGALKKVPFNRMPHVVIAYEPVWAIGTGETASPEQAQEMHAFIRKEIASLYEKSESESLPILYGGSMKPGNAAELLSQPDVDGGLIGGASLKADDFAQIVEIANQQR